MKKEKSVLKILSFRNKNKFKYNNDNHNNSSMQNISKNNPKVLNEFQTNQDNQMQFHFPNKEFLTNGL